MIGSSMVQGSMDRRLRVARRQNSADRLAEQRLRSYSKPTGGKSAEAVPKDQDRLDWRSWEAAGAFDEMLGLADELARPDTPVLSRGRAQSSLPQRPPEASPWRPVVRRAKCWPIRTYEAVDAPYGSVGALHNSRG